MSGRERPRPAISQDDLNRLRMALGRLGRVLRQHVDADLPYAQTSLLFAISRLEPATVGTLAEAENVSAPSVSRSLTKLVGLGLVDRLPDPTDGRVFHIRLTPAGRRARDKVLEARHAWLTERLGAMTAEEVTLLFAALPSVEALGRPAAAPSS